jgi:hypothetical protein
MKLYHTSGRNRLLTTTVSEMMMLGINGPSLREWNAEKYVVSWLKKGKHGALDKRTGIASKPVEVKSSTKLFAFA